MISMTRIVDNWDCLFSVIWDFGKLYENYITLKYLMLNGLSWKQLIFTLWVYIRKCPSKFTRITILESLWYKFMRYLWAWKLSLTINLMQHNATLEKAMAPHSSTLAWKIPWTEEPGGLQPMSSRRVRYDWVTSLSLFTFMHWRRKWQPTPVFLPGESQGRGSLVGCHLWGCTESDMTEAT